MKFAKLTKRFTQQLQKSLKGEAAQGATEYILLLVIVVGIALAFGPRIKQAVGDKVTELTTGMSQVTTK